MSKDGKESRRRSFFGALSGLQNSKDDSEPANLLRKRRTVSLMTSLSAVSQRGDEESLHGGAIADRPTSPARPQLSRGSGSGSGSGNRSSSVFGSRKGFHLPEDHEKHLSVTSARTLSSHWPAGDDTLRNRQVLHHGEVQTSSSMFRKKKEYLVLTETHLIRFKSHQKAAEAFPTYISHSKIDEFETNIARITSPYARMSIYRHSQSPSAGSSHELQSAASDASGDRDLGTPLRQIIAVYQLDDGRPHFAFEVSHLDDETNHASSMTLQFGDPDEMNSWLVMIRDAANRVRLTDSNPLSAYNSHLAARVVEAERDYVPPHYAIYKVVQRPQAKSGSRASSDDLPKILASVCFLAIGVHKVHLIPLFKPPSQRSSSPSLGSHNAQSSYGILNITELRVSEFDDTFELTFRYVELLV